MQRYFQHKPLLLVLIRAWTLSLDLNYVSQLLEPHPSIIEQLHNEFPVAHYLLVAPFLEASDRLGVLANGVWDGLQLMHDQDALLVKHDQSLLLLSYLESLDAELQQAPSPQHGDAPCFSSIHALYAIFGRVDASISTDKALDSRVTIAQDTAFQRLQDVTSRVILQVLNMPISHGEAAKLVQCWVCPTQEAKDWARHTPHSLLGMCFGLSCSLLEGAASLGVSPFVADGTPTILTQVISYEESAVNMIEALWNAGLWVWEYGFWSILD